MQVNEFYRIRAPFLRAMHSCKLLLLPFPDKDANLPQGNTHPRLTRLSSTCIELFAIISPFLSSQWVSLLLH